jgi:fluoride exporter
MAREDSIMPDVRLLAAISTGGVLGALGRYGLRSLFPHGVSAFGWATLATNVAGCLLIGIIAAVAAETRRAPRLTSPFLVTGVLGGFTTFSAYIVDVQRALAAGAPRVALLYGAATLVAALAAAWTGAWLAALVFRPRAAVTAGDESAAGVLAADGLAADGLVAAMAHNLVRAAWRPGQPGLRQGQGRHRPPRPDRGCRPHRLARQRSPHPAPARRVAPPA